MSAGTAIPELTMDLDSIITQSRKAGMLGARRRGRGGRSIVANSIGRGTASRTTLGEPAPFLRPFAASNRTAGKRTIANESIPDRRRMGGFASARRASDPTGTSGAKVVVSNLDFGVTEDDLWEIFTRCGSVRKIQLNFDCYGQSTGTAVVQYDHQSEALKSIEEFHNVPLDSRRMSLELSISPSKLQPQVQAHISGEGGRLGRKINSGTDKEHHRSAKSGGIGGRGSDGFSGRFRRGRGGRGGGGAGFRRSRGNGGQKSLSDLDVDLDAYMAQRSVPTAAGGSEAMQTD